MRARSLACVLLAAGLLGGCGDEADDEPAALTPEQVRSNLQDAGYEVGEPITSGANEAVADNGRLDAQAYLDVEAGPAGESLFGGVYFFETPADAELLDREMTREDDEFGAHELRETRVYNVSGTQQELEGIVAAAEGE